MFSFGFRGHFVLFLCFDDTFSLCLSALSLFLLSLFPLPFSLAFPGYYFSPWKRVFRQIIRNSSEKAPPKFHCSPSLTLLFYNPFISWSHFLSSFFLPLSSLSSRFVTLEFFSFSFFLQHTENKHCVKNKFVRFFRFFFPSRFYNFIRIVQSPFVPPITNKTMAYNVFNNVLVYLISLVIWLLNELITLAALFTCSRVFYLSSHIIAYFHLTYRAWNY